MVVSLGNAVHPNLGHAVYHIITIVEKFFVNYQHLEVHRSNTHFKKCSDGNLVNFEHLKFGVFFL